VETLALVLLAATVGLLVGLAVGTRRAYNLLISGRGLRTTQARIARFMPPTMPERTAADMLAGRVRLLLGETTYELPVLPRGPSKRWVESLDGRWGALSATLESAGDDTPVILTALLGEMDALYDLLLSYDQTGVLPGREVLDEEATDAQVLQGVLEVWRAAHPLVATLSESASGPLMPGTSFEQPST
jgi:hypothetical protein